MAADHDPELALSVPNLTEPDRIVDLGVATQAAGWILVTGWLDELGDLVASAA